MKRELRRIMSFSAYMLSTTDLPTGQGRPYTYMYVSETICWPVPGFSVAVVSCCVSLAVFCCSCLSQPATSRVSDASSLLLHVRCCGLSLSSLAVRL